MKVNYQERIEATVSELKIIMQRQRTISNRQKVQALYLLKSGFSQSITDVAELLGVHRVTVQRWLKQYNAGGLSSLLKIRQSTGRPRRVIPTAVIAGISKKISEESCEFKSYKQIVTWVKDNYQISVKYQTLHKQVHYRMKAKLKVPISLKQKDTPFFFSQFPKSGQKNSRSPITMTLYSENNGKTCCRFVVCSSKLLLSNLCNNDQYKGIALCSQIKPTMNKLIQPH